MGTKCSIYRNYKLIYIFSIHACHLVLGKKGVVYVREKYRRNVRAGENDKSNIINCQTAKSSETPIQQASIPHCYVHH